MDQVNGSVASRVLSATEMGPEDRNHSFADAVTKAGQGSHPKETNLPKYIVKTGFGHRNA